MDKLFSNCVGLILAAGRSERMGTPKSNLPWGNTSVLGQVIRTLTEGGLHRIFIVINPFRKPEILGDLPDVEITWIDNPEAETAEMLKSIQTGLSAFPENVQNGLITLGDQPTIRMEVVKKMLLAIQETEETLIFPSYRKKRGHPWAVNKIYWAEICELTRTDTPRTFIKAHADDIHYIDFDLEPPEDIDTPEMYHRLKLEAGM
ncbi:MAG: nucleotidyltransferase family protein [Leptolinea sp.]